jgi:anti-anti-sigma factor
VVDPGTVEVDDSGGCVVVSLIGYHDLDSVEHVRRPLSQAVDDGRPLVIDVSETDMLDSIVLGSIITAHARCANRGVAAVIVADERTRPVVRNLLRVSGISANIDVYPNLSDATESLAARDVTR